MSKTIKVTPEEIGEIRRGFEEFLKSLRNTDTEVVYKTSLGKESGEKSTLVFAETAWIKMQALISEFDSEVAWHGVAERAENNRYIVSDILVYPQKVTGAYVDMDEAEYGMWIEKNIEDERFFNIHLQGHSHVKMQTTPSGTDMESQRKITEMLNPDDGFYIFVIWNKFNRHNVRILDMKKNIAFENEDITVEVMCGENTVSSFIKEAQSLVTPKKYKKYTQGDIARIIDKEMAYSDYENQISSSDFPDNSTLTIARNIDYRRNKIKGE